MSEKISEIRIGPDCMVCHRAPFAEAIDRRHYTWVHGDDRQNECKLLTLTGKDGLLLKIVLPIALSLQSKDLAGLRSEVRRAAGSVPYCFNEIGTGKQAAELFRYCENIRRM